jgi:Domain of unknown function (DUF4373)
VRWFAMSTQTFTDPKVVELGERHGPVGLAWWTLLLCEAGAQEKAGKVDVAVRSFAHELFTDPDTVNKVLDSAIEVGLCHAESRDVRSFKVEISRWERHQAKKRKADQRGREKGLEKADDAESHAESQKVTTDRQTVQTDKSSSTPVPANLETVFSALERVAFARNQPSAKPDAVIRACEQYVAIEHLFAAEAENFASYWIDGPGEKQSMGSIAWHWRNWLGNVKPADALKVTKVLTGKVDRSIYDAKVEAAS